ncbi:MAG: DUF805 domain-containing protein [Ferruginibacter sp.]
MNPFNYYVNVLKNYANFEGRARRSEYWYFTLFHFIIAMVLSYASMILYAVYVLGVLVPGIAVAVRRMHDVGKSGWYCLIPIYNLILALTPGVSGSNEYGPDPKGNPLDDDINQIGRN